MQTTVIMAIDLGKERIPCAWRKCRGSQGFAEAALRARSCHNVAAVALANKIARVAWALMSRGDAPSSCLRKTLTT